VRKSLEIQVIPMRCAPGYRKIVRLQKLFVRQLGSS